MPDNRLIVNYATPQTAGSNWRALMEKACEVACWSGVCLLIVGMLLAAMAVMFFRL